MRNSRFVLSQPDVDFFEFNQQPLRRTVFLRLLSLQSLRNLVPETTRDVGASDVWAVGVASNFIPTPAETDGGCPVLHVMDQIHFPPPEELLE